MAVLSFNYNNTGVTVELGEIVDSGVDIWAFEYPTPAEKVTYNGKTAPVPFDKGTFEQKIIDHYRFRQIGQETVGRWLHYFRTRIREIMPYYVQLYEFEAKWFNVDDPLESYNLKEEYSEERSGSGTVTGTSSGNATVSDNSSGQVTREATGKDEKSATLGNVKKFSNTPQGTITNLDDHLTEATVDDGTSSEDVTRTESGTEETSGTSEQTSESTGTSEQTSEDTGTVTSTMTRRGNIGVQPLGTEVKNIREAFINIDLMVINELKDLFLQVY